MEKRRWVLMALYALVSSLSLAQSMQGVVFDEGNTPIENALVVREDDTSVWVKTASDGTFTIDGTTAQKYRIAALNFTTEKYHAFSNTSGNEITLANDALLDSDVYHISFDHLRPGDFYSIDELKKDFTIAYGKGFYDGSDPESNRSFVDVEESVDLDGTSLRVTFPKGKLKTADSGVDTRIYLSGNYKTADEFQADELYVSYWVKYSDNFDFKCGGKMPSLGGEFVNSNDDGNERWKGRTMWRNGGSIQFYPELPHSEDKFDHDSLRFWGEKEFDGGDICTNQFTSYMRNGEWHNIELHYVLDDGVSGGLFEGWVDGGKGYKSIDSEVFGFYRRQNEGLDNLTLNFLMISTFFGGSSVDYEPDEDVYAWFDEFRVSSTRIDEYEKYTLLTSEENGVEREPTSIYPNPSNTGVFTLSEAEHYVVYNAQGYLVKKAKSKSIDLSELSKGVYLVKMDEIAVKIIHE